ncbi:MAG: S41 family peptidase [Eubacteriales bacterium]|nr:S41 family peptidase [Eubacteriales bacterium]
MKKRVLTALAILVVLSLGLMLTGQAAGLFDFTKKGKTVTISQDEYDRMSRYARMDEILQYVEAWYYQEPDVDALIENATRGLLYGLEDPYSFYYNEDEWKELWEDDEGEYAGIGIQLLGNYLDYSVTVTQVFRDTPAQQAGLRKGDLLVRVEDIEVTAYTMQNAVNVMRGKVGEEVEIEVQRGDEFITFRIPRAQIHVNRIEYTMLDNHVGYILMYEFAGESQKEFSDALAALRAQGAQALVVDLRDNGGGWVDAAISIGDLFLDEGILAYSQDRYGNREDYKTTDGKDDIPLVFLVNENSASASEILSGGLQDLGRATVVGQTTFGKGIVQTVIGLDNDEAGFQMTYAQYFLPSGAEVHKIGITPDVIAEMPEDLKTVYFDLGDLTDPQLKTAWETAQSMIPAAQ